jgi:2-polyprenyl-3-methyl-5-hydroxy-6-metoxy-1,4-benzoquinol methylase
MPTIVLADQQEKIIAEFREKVSRGVYKMESNPCLCGASNDVIISEKDRYGIDLTTVLCKNCGLLRSDPYYTDDTLNKFYNNEFPRLYRFSKTKESLFQDEIIRGKLIKEYIEKKTCINVKNKKVCEVGCGAAGALKVFKDSGADVLGCDYGRKYLSIAKQHEIMVLEGGIEVLEGKDKADIIILNHVLEHMKNPKEDLKKLSKLVREGGIVYISVPGLNTHHKTYGSIRNYIQNAHVWHFTLNTLTALMASLGFTKLCGDEKIRAIYQKGNQSLVKSNYKWFLPFLYLKLSYKLPFIFNLYSKLYQGHKKVYKSFSNRLSL